LEAAAPRIEVCRLTTAGEFRQRLEDDVRYGLTLPRRWIPSKYRYDAEGSVLFERVIEQPEYVPRRAETAILAENSDRIMKLASPDEFIELGSGYSKKTRLLVEAMRATGCTRYVPVDISESAIREAAAALTADYDWLQVQGQVGDYDHDLPRIKRNGRRLLAIFGTTLCNYTSKPECMEFVKKMKSVMQKGDSVLIGIDLLKDISAIKSAYTDEAGANAKFKIRILEILNREVGSDFNVQDFKYGTRWDPEKSAIESLLFAKRDLSVSISSLGLDLQFSKGDEILVGISCKFTKEEFIRELTDLGLDVVACYTDRGFGMFLASAV
jgi:L-histidine N-alpha-methyltransferase